MYRFLRPWTPSVWLAYLLLGLVLIPSQALALTCIEEPSAISALRRSTVVFEGVAEEVGYEENSSAYLRGDRKRVRFRVLRAWKGVESESIVVYCGIRQMGGSALRVAAGEQWLIFASLHRGDLSASACMRSAPSWRAHEQFRDLGHPAWQPYP